MSKHFQKILMACVGGILSCNAMAADHPQVI